MNWDEHQTAQERRHDTPCSGADPEASDEPQTVLAWLLCLPAGGRQAVPCRHGVGSPRALCPAPAKPSVTSFKGHAPRFARVDVNYLPPMADEDTRRYRFVAIDRATRWAYVAINPDESARAFEAFPAALAKALPFRIADLLRTLHFRSRDDLTLCRCAARQPAPAPAQVLGAHTPTQALQSWCASYPEPFQRKPNNRTERDTYLKAGKRTVYRLAQKGEIPTFKPGGTGQLSLPGAGSLDRRTHRREEAGSRVSALQIGNRITFGKEPREGLTACQFR